MKPLENHERPGLAGISLHRLVRQLREARLMLCLLESGDGIIGSTAKSLAFRARVKSDIGKIETEMDAETLRMATDPCPRCGGCGYKVSDSFVATKCPKCQGDGYRHRLANDQGEAQPPAK